MPASPTCRQASRSTKVQLSSSPHICEMSLSSYKDVLFILKTDCLQQAHLEGYKMLIDLKAALHQSNLNPERPGIISFSSSSSDYFHGNHNNLVSCVYFLS
jgi:hypothetical protein